MIYDRGKWSEEGQGDRNDREAVQTSGEAIWTVLDHPELPLTNNVAERLLRHWVIARKISCGTRSEQGSRAFALLASVIEPCRQRQILPWPHLADVIAERRKGNPAPPLPVAAH